MIEIIGRKQRHDIKRGKHWQQNLMKTQDFKDKIPLNFCDFWLKKGEKNQKDIFSIILNSKNRYLMMGNLFLATTALIPNDAYEFDGEPRNRGTQRNKKEWIAKYVFKIRKLES